MAKYKYVVLQNDGSGNIEEVEFESNEDRVRVEAHAHIHQILEQIDLEKENKTVIPKSKKK